VPQSAATYASASIYDPQSDPLDRSFQLALDLSLD
jgi:hypothetical protein